MFTDTVSDEVFHAPKVVEQAFVWPGQPVQKAREDVVQLGRGQSWRGLEEQAGVCSGADGARQVDQVARQPVLKDCRIL